MAHVKIQSNGLPTGTHVFVDGKRLDTTKVAFAIGMDEPAKATIEVYVDEIEVDGEMMMSRKP